MRRWLTRFGRVIGWSAAFVCAVTAFATHAAAAPGKGNPNEPPVPADNPSSVAKVELGKQLFFDPRISKTGTVSCNSCHNVMADGADGRPTSVGIDGKVGDRNAPTVWNAAFLSVQFWDGRAATLEEQAKGPMTNPVEMGMASHDLVIDRIKHVPGYVEQFLKVFGGLTPLTIDNVARAIAAYERTLVTTNSPHERFERGQKKALDAAQLRGDAAFDALGCCGCHSGAQFAGPTLPLGEGFYQVFPGYPDPEIEAKYTFLKDTGRHRVTNQDADRNMWRVSGLRNVALTAPYFHNGAVPTLAEAVRVMAKLQLNRTLSDTETDDLVAFLNALTGEFPKQTLPRLPLLPNRSVIEP